MKIVLGDADAGGEPADGCVWITKEVVRAIVERYCPGLVVNDRAPAWAAATGDAVCAALVLHDFDASAVFSRVRESPEIQAAVVAAYRVGAGGYAIVDMVSNWRSA